MYDLTITKIYNKTKLAFVIRQMLFNIRPPLLSLVEVMSLLSDPLPINIPDMDVSPEFVKTALADCAEYTYTKIDFEAEYNSQYDYKPSVNEAAMNWYNSLNEEHRKYVMELSALFAPIA